MALLTLATVREKLWTYADMKVPYASATVAQKAEADFRINQVSERILGNGKWKNTLRRVIIPIYDEYITLPRELGTILSVTLITAAGNCCVSTIYTRFHQVAHNAPACASMGSIAVSETAQTFITPEDTWTFRIKSTVAAGTVTFYGGYDENGDQYFDGETVNIANGTANGTRQYTSMPETGGIQKTTTTVPVELYSVDTVTGDETLIAVYAPYEEVPAYRKYKVPNWNSVFTNALVLGKLGYVPAINDHDIVIPSNWGALKIALKALRGEDTDEDDKSRKDWEEVYNILNAEVSESDADSELPLVRVQGQYACTGIESLV